MNKYLRYSAYGTALLIAIIGAVMLFQGDIYGIFALATSALFAFVIYKQ